MKLGVKAQDSITGFCGTVTGTCQYISGCNQSLLAPRVKEGGDFVESHWFDDDRLSVIDADVVVLKVTANGPDREAPRK